MFWNGFCFNFPLGLFPGTDLIGKPIIFEGEEIGVITKVVTDVEHACERVYARLHSGASFIVTPSMGHDTVEVSIGCKPVG